MARALLPLCEVAGCPEIQLPGTVSLVHVRNAGSALGFLQGLDLWMVLGIAALVLVPMMARRILSPSGRIGLGLLVGGAAGNLVDRFLWGGVTDFIGIGGQVVINLADVALIVGCVLATRALTHATRPAPPALEDLQPGLGR